VYFAGTTLRPFADTDLMWGINGLGNMADADRAAGELFSKLMENMTSSLKKEMMVNAAVMTSVTITLAVAFPVVGTIIGGLIAVIGTLSGGKYMREAEQVIADTQNQLQILSNDYHLKTNARDERLLESLRPYAIQLAISDQQLPPKALAGIVGMGDFWSDAKNVVQTIVRSPVHQLKRSLNKAGLKEVTKIIEKVEKEGQSALDTLSGRNALVEARKAAAQVMASARADFERVYLAHVESLKNPEFQKNLIIQLAHQMREDPEFKKLQLSPGVAAAQKGGVVAAAGIAAAVVAFAALGGKH
jgi:hypothetical protein